jgi:cleavage and polyadenylation specificity factor subunit 3
MRSALALTVLGGAQEIGANSYHLDLGGSGLLLDAGIHPKRQGREALPGFGAVKGEVDAILISHSHLDHVGALPVALERFPAAKVYMTGPSALLAIRMLRNAVAVSRNRDGTSLFSHDHVEWVEQVVSTLEPDRAFTLDTVGGRPTIALTNAGHVLGAIGVLVEHRDRRFFYTGDTCANGQYICGPARYPQPPLDLLLMDSTHGADPEPDLGRDRRSFGRAVTDLGRFITTVASRGGSVLLPVFAMGRTQEILGVLYELGRRGRIPRLPVHISGLAQAVCRIYDTTRRDSDRRRPTLRLEDLGYRILDPDSIADPAFLQEPRILAVTSGMMFPNTSSNLLAQRMLPDPRHGVAFVGFLDPDSPGYRVARARAGEEVSLGATPGEGPRVPVACDLCHLGFTAHSRASQLIRTACELKPRHVVLVHGDVAATETLAQRMREAGLTVTVAEPNTVVEF